MATFGCLYLNEKSKINVIVELLVFFTGKSVYLHVEIKQHYFSQQWKLPVYITLVECALWVFFMHYLYDNSHQSSVIKTRKKYFMWKIQTDSGKRFSCIRVKMFWGTTTAIIYITEILCEMLFIVIYLLCILFVLKYIYMFLLV